VLAYNLRNFLRALATLEP